MPPPRPGGIDDQQQPSSPVPAIGGERWMIARSPARSRPLNRPTSPADSARGDGVIGRALRQPLGRLPAIGGDEPQPDIIGVEFPAAIAGDAFDPHLHPSSPVQVA